MNNESFPRIKNNLEETYKSKIQSLAKLKENLIDAEREGDTRKIDIYVRKISNSLAGLSVLESKIANMRPNNEKDIENRIDILDNYAEKIDNAISDDDKVVFHGNSNIGEVEKIIKSGGLKTPEERGIDEKSFATEIDVTAKKNIKSTLDFADSGINSFMPYGAIFVFYPKDYEKEKVLKTGTSSEVLGGVSGVNFSEKRFIGIITTEENKKRLRETLIGQYLDSNKVFTHEEFLNYAKENMRKNENRVGK